MNVTDGCVQTDADSFCDESYGRAVLLMAVSTAFINPFVASAVNVALPVIASEFSADAVLISWVAASYLLVSAVFTLPSGGFADVYGRRKLYLIGMSIFSAASLLCAISSSAFMLIVARALQGAGSAMIFSTSMAILVSAYPGKGRGRALGLTVASTYTGLSAGPFIGGIITQYSGWRVIFWFSAAVSVYAALLTYFRVRPDSAAGCHCNEKYDYFGSGAYICASAFALYGFIRFPEAAGIYMVLISFAFFIFFFRHESISAAPLLNVNLFKTSRAFTLSNLAALIHYSATFGLTFLLSLYLQYNKGMTPREAGAVLIAQPLMMAVFSPLVGRLSEKIEPAVLASSGMALTGVGLVFFIPLTASTPTVYIIANLLMIGFGFALFSSPNINAVMSSVESRYYGVASGVLSTMRIVGQALSMGISSMIIALYVGRQKITSSNYGDFLCGMKAAFIIFAGLCAAGIFCSLARGKMHKTQH